MYKQNKTEVTKNFGSDIETGLTSQQVEQQRTKYGWNRLDDKKEKPFILKVLLQMRDLTTVILIAAAIVSFYMAITTEHADYLEGIIIIVIVLINAILGVVQEGNAEKAIASLQKVNKQVVRCLRDGITIEILAEELVPGDILIVEAGDMLAADARLIESFSLTIDESALTGESIVTEKDADVLFTETVPLGDRTNMLYAGCLVTNGRAVALVVATGMQTEIGKIAALLNNEKLELTPLQQKLNKLGRTISIIALMAAAVVFTVGILQGEEVLDMFMTAISLAVAAVPETLMIIVTLTLSFGVQKMVKKRAIIRRLPAVETLGSASVICSDKTGTLTQNKMTTQLIWTSGDEYININYLMNRETVEILKMGTLCSDAYIDRESDEEVGVGAPTELAIVYAAEAQDFTKEDLEQQYPRVAELPFDSTRKLMTTVHQVEDGTFLSITKGAFDVMSDLCTTGDLVSAKHMNNVFGKKALRVIAIGVKKYQTLPENLDTDELENNLELLGIIGMIDPPRPESKDAIAKAAAAGIKTVMITGDHIVTATAIARDLGILKHQKEAMTGAQLDELTDEELLASIESYSVYARVSPENKIRIVKAWQKDGAVVAMTGDGVNDAPALKASDVGCAMGITGTDVAQSASDIILTDDNFATIVDAVEEGRTAYENIRKTIYFLLSCNISEILIVLIAMLLGWGIPVVAIQILFINVVADGLPGFALSREKPDGDIMKRNPVSKDESVFSNGYGIKIAMASIGFTILTLLGYYAGSFVNLSDSVPSHAMGQTMAFIIIGVSSVIHIFNVRSKYSIFKIGFQSNKQLTKMAILAIVLILSVAAIPFLQDVFYLVPLDFIHWQIAILLSIMPLVFGEIAKLFVSDEDQA